MNRALAGKITDALAGLARANVVEFQRSPDLCAAYLANLRAGRHKYTPDRVTCGYADCWSTYRALVERYPTGPILLDCEDAACAHSGWLATQCYADRIFVGLIPGSIISHAVSGVEKAGETVIQLVDPCIWYGMPPTRYDNPVWRPVDRSR